jgi:hypothetical protein
MVPFVMAGHCDPLNAGRDRQPVPQPWPALPQRDPGLAAAHAIKAISPAPTSRFWVRGFMR